MSRKRRRAPSWELPERVANKRSADPRDRPIPQEILCLLNNESVLLKEWRGHLQETVTVPSLTQECARHQHTESLRTFYANLCKDKLHWKDAPKSSFNRFLTDHLLDKATSSPDPLLPSLVDLQEAPSDWATRTRLYQEMEEDFPEKIKPPLQFVTDWRKMKNHMLVYI